MIRVIQFFRRFVGALALDAGAFEDIEADRRASMQSVMVVAAVCAASGIAAAGLGTAGAAGFVSGALIALGAWLTWVSAIATLGTLALAEPQTKSDLRELLRVLGYAAAPGVFIGFAALRSAAPFVAVLVTLWMTAAAVIGMRQALDYRSTARALVVCVAGWLLASAIVGAVLMLYTQRVS